MRNTDSKPSDLGIVPFESQYADSTAELILGIQRDEFGFSITLADQPDHRFYEKNGFQLIDPDTLPARFPKMKVDTRFYRLGLC